MNTKGIKSSAAAASGPCRQELPFGAGVGPPILRHVPLSAD